MNEKVNKGPIATRVASSRSSFQSGTFPNEPRFLPFPQLHNGLTVRPSTSAGIPFAMYSQVSKCSQVLQRSANAGKRSLHVRASSSRVRIWMRESFLSTGEIFGIIFSTKGTTHASTTTVCDATSSLISLTKIKVYMPTPLTGLKRPKAIRGCCGSSKPEYSEYWLNITAILCLRLTSTPLSARFGRSLTCFSSERVMRMWMESHSSFFFVDGSFNAGRISKLR